MILMIAPALRTRRAGIPTAPNASWRSKTRSPVTRGICLGVGDLIGTLSHALLVTCRKYRFGDIILFGSIPDILPVCPGTVQCFDEILGIEPFQIKPIFYNEIRGRPIF